MNAAWSRRRMLGATLGLAGTCGLGALAARGAGVARPAGMAAASVPAAGAEGAPLLVVQDGRHAASRRHAAMLAPRAVRVLDARADLARQWYGELRAQAERGPLALQGLTSWADFVVMRGCAAECGLRAATHELLRGVDGSGCTLVRWRIGRTLA